MLTRYRLWSSGRGVVRKKRGFAWRERHALWRERDVAVRKKKG